MTAVQRITQLTPGIFAAEQRCFPLFCRHGWPQWELCAWVTRPLPSRSRGTARLPCGSPAAHLLGWFIPLTGQTPIYSLVSGVSYFSCGLVSWISSLQGQTHSGRCKEIQERAEERQGWARSAWLTWEISPLGLSFAFPDRSFHLSSLLILATGFPSYTDCWKVTMLCFLLRWQVNQSCPAHQAETFSAAVPSPRPMGKVQKMSD